MLRHLVIGLLLAVILSLSSACGTGQVEQQSAEPISSAPPEVVQKAKEFISERNKISADQITLKQSQSVQWGDACLGAAKPDEMCAQVITPGYQVDLSTPQGSYQLHTDQTAQRIRLVLQ